MHKILGISGYLERCNEEYEEKKEILEDKWLHKVQNISEERDYIYDLFSKSIIFFFIFW